MAGPGDDAFVTTWKTSLGTGNTVTLGLAGEVDAKIYWGDGTITTVTTPGPHSHDYSAPGIYTVSVTGSVTGYNSRDKGGPVSERRKLVSVDSWGHPGFTNLSWAFTNAENLVSVPGVSDGIEGVTNMSGMFKCARLFNKDIGGWNTSNVTDMSTMFGTATSFNQYIGDWNTSNVTNMTSMFSNASQFNQNLSGWCVSLITMKPDIFDVNAYNWSLPQPIWGTCP